MLPFYALNRTLNDDSFKNFFIIIIFFFKEKR